MRSQLHQTAGADPAFYFGVGTKHFGMTFPSAEGATTRAPKARGGAASPQRAKRAVAKPLRNASGERALASEPEQNFFPTV